MKKRFEFEMKLNLGHAITIVSTLLLVGTMYGTFRAEMAQMRREMDDTKQNVRNLVMVSAQQHEDFAVFVAKVGAKIQVK